MSKKIINPKSGIIIKCPLDIRIVKIILKSTDVLDIYYVNKVNIENLKEFGKFKDKNGIIYENTGKTLEEFINVISEESYFVLINNNENRCEISFEIKDISNGYLFSPHQVIKITKSYENLVIYC